MYKITLKPVHLLEQVFLLFEKCFILNYSLNLWENNLL